MMLKKYKREDEVVAYVKHHKKLPSDEYEHRYKQPLLDTVQFGANLEMLNGYEVACLDKIKR